MNTDSVIEAIDHALDDFSVSGDAMRWRPNTAWRALGPWRTLGFLTSDQAITFGMSHVIVERHGAETGYTVMDETHVWLAGDAPEVDRR